MIYFIIYYEPEKCKFKAKCKARDDKTNALGAENRLKANEFEEFE